MSDLICRKTMMRCQTPGMCSPHGGCNPQAPVALTGKHELDQLRHDCEKWEALYRTEHASCTRVLDTLTGFRSENDRLKSAIRDPESVFINMKAGKIAKPTLRSMVDLYGEVINGEDALLLELARLRGEIEEMKKDHPE